MSTLVWLSLAMTLSSSPAPGSLAAAAESIASGTDDGTALTRLRDAGKKGLWALAEVAPSKSGAERGRVFEGMGYFTGPDAEWALLVELRKADPATKAGVLRGLARLGAPKLLGPILDGLTDPDPIVRDGALDAALLFGPRVRSDLVALAQSPDPKRRVASLRYVARSKSNALLTEALPAALRDPSPAVQAVAIPLAARSRDGIHTAQLARLARSDDPTVALLAVDGLRVLRGANGAFELASITSDRAVVEPAWRSAAAAIRTFGAAGLPAFVEGVERAQPERRTELVERFAGELSDEEFGVLVAMLADPRAPKAAVARDLLVRSGDRGADVAFERLGVATGRARAAIVDFLESRTETQFAQRLLTRARDGQVSERLSAIELLGELGEEDALRSLAPMLSDPLAEIRARTAEVVAVVPDAALREEVIHLVRAEDRAVRIGALRGLAKITPRDADLVRAGLRGLVDADEAVRLAAIDLLAVPSDPSVVRAFRSRTLEAAPRERVAIARALTDSRLPEAIVLLVDLATDIDASVKAAAVAALGGRAQTPADR